MNLREQLLERSKVARCAYQQTQPATFQQNSATLPATTAQLNPANPHEIRVSSATTTATTPQLSSCAGGQKVPLKVALSCAPVADPETWRELDRAYLAHHFNCPNCVAAGQGRGLRCGVGAALWTSYQNTEEKS
jgi:hypothetical protein